MDPVVLVSQTAPQGTRLIDTTTTQHITHRTQRTAYLPQHLPHSTPTHSLVSSLGGRFRLSKLSSYERLALQSTGQSTPVVCQSLSPESFCPRMTPARCRAPYSNIQVYIERRWLSRSLFIHRAGSCPSEPG